MPYPCSLMWFIIRFVWASVKEGMKETPDARKKIGRFPVLQPELVRYSPQTLERDSPSVPHANTITIRSISETLEGDLLGKKNLPCVVQSAIRGNWFCNHTSQQKYQKNSLLFSCAGLVESTGALHCTPLDYATQGLGSR